MRQSITDRLDDLESELTRLRRRLDYLEGLEMDREITLTRDAVGDVRSATQDLDARITRLARCGRLVVPPEHEGTLQFYRAAALTDLCATLYNTAEPFDERLFAAEVIVRSDPTPAWGAWEDAIELLTAKMRDASLPPATRTRACFAIMEAMRNGARPDREATRRALEEQLEEYEDKRQSAELARGSEKQ